MVLSVSKDLSIPSDAVKLTRNEALRYQMKMVQQWEPFSEVFTLRAGAGILALISGVSGTVILSHFRKKLKLGVYGKVTSYFPGVVLPAFFAAILHTTEVQNKILLREYDCPLCLQTKAVFAQTTAALIYPFLLSPMVSFMYATRHFTVRLPYVTEQPKEWLKLWLRLTRSGKSIAGYVLAASIIGSIAVTTREFHEFAEFQIKLDEFEKKVDNGSITELA